MSLEPLLRSLVRFPTLSADHRENQQALEWVAGQVPSQTFQSRITVGGFPSLVLTTQRTKTPKLFLSAHIDIVAGPKKMFRARKVDRTLVGRGVFDMKYAIACFVRLLKELGSELSLYDFGVMITSDEEVGGKHGVPALLDRGYGSQCCFLPDGLHDWKLVSESKGVLHYRVVATGKSAHGSKPWLGQNAIENLMAFLTDCRQAIPRVNKRDGKIRDTLNIGFIKGGHQANSVASDAEATINIRFVERDERAYRVLLERIRKRHAGIKLEPVLHASRFTVDRNDPTVTLWRKVAKKHTGRQPVFESAMGTSDARFFSERNIPTIVTRPRGGNSHSDNEWIDLADLERFYGVLKEFVSQVAKR